ncbi:glycoside hydrolase [Chlorella sorokiniana]|uniref:Glycoside hydrolase n=1 Tax=Chlorella sorokiniana TaxID=3076 RepID=A0A2P6TYW7_CHLSO|nr:glycoside hydrolase [Chlorella sorokiniana]|eukprot:PRW59249.1 glycoside hydrolase [Chlorella sorokiniana]
MAVEALDSLELEFDRYFARQQLGTDAFGCAIGAAVYLGLLHTTLSQGRPDLAAGALLCIPFALWPQALARLGLREKVHVRYRDYLLLIHQVLHYSIGGQFARVVRLQDKMVTSTPAAFLAGFVLSSSLPWQVLDSLLYRMRMKRFVVFKIVVMFSVTLLEWRVCELTCQAMPEESSIFGAGSRLLRRLASPLPLTLSLPPAHEDAVVSCFKLHAFNMLTLTWVLPAFVLRRLEQQAWRSFLRARSGQLPNAASLLDSQMGTKAVVPWVVAPITVVLPALAMHASGGGLGMSLTAAGLVLLALLLAPLPKQTGSWPAAERAPLAEADRQALEEAAAAPLVWWPGLPGWAAAALLLATCWHAIDLFQGPL